MVVPQTELALGADHPVGVDTTDGSSTDLEITGEHRPGPGHRHIRAVGEVPRTANDLLGAGPGVHLAHPHLVGGGMGCDLLDLPHDDIGPPGVEDIEALHFVPEHGEDIRQLSRIGGRQLDELLEPAKRDLHRNWLRKRRSLSTK